MPEKERAAVKKTVVKNVKNIVLKSIAVTAVYGKLKKKLYLENGSTAMDAIRQMGVHPEIVLVKREDEIIPHEEPLNNGDNIELLRVVTGG